jgi:hypothetical protein
MNMFDSNYLAELEQRYRTLPPHARSPVAQVALSSENKKLRDAIEAMLARLHPDDVPILVAKLKNADFVDSLNELRVASLLIGRGCLPRYEQLHVVSGKNLTPDWSSPAAARAPEFVLDVFTLNVADEIELLEKQETDLQHRVAKIPVGAVISTHVDGEPPFSPNFNKKAAHAIRHWLRDVPPADASIDVENVRFEFHLPRQKAGVVMIAPVRTFWLTTSRFEENYKCKADKYAPLSKPLIVAVAADFRTGLTFSDVEESLRKASARLFDARPNVAGLLWLDDDSDGPSHRFLASSAGGAFIELFE